MRFKRTGALLAFVLAGCVSTVTPPDSTFVSAADTEARANPFKACNGPFCNVWPGHFGNQHSWNGGLPPGNGYAHKPRLPVYLAAPWYLYWPYDAHFLTPAPVGGMFYPPPVPGNFPSQPYFPVQPPPYVPGSPLNSYPLTAPK